MNKRKIISKLLLILIITFVVIGSISVFLFNYHVKKRELELLNESVNNTVKFLEKAYQLPLWNYENSEIVALNTALLNNDYIVAINLFDEEYNLIAAHKKAGKDYNGLTVENDNIKADINDESHIFKRSFKINYLGHSIGIAELFYTNVYTIESVNNSSLAVSIAHIMLMLSLMLIVYIFTSTNILSHIIKLAKISQTIADKDDYSLRLKTKLNDEIGILYGSFNMMLEKIEQRDIKRDIIEKELLHMQRYLSNIIHFMPSILITLNNDCVITEWNNSAENYFKISHKQACGKQLSEIVPEFMPYLKYFEAKHESIDFNRQRLNGSVMNVQIYPIKNPELENIVIIAEDVTELENKNSQLQQAQKMESVGNLAGGVAHEINNMLSGIIGILSIMKYNINKQNNISLDKLKEYHDMMESSANRAAYIVQQLLSISKKQEFSLFPIDLNQPISNVATMCKSTFDKSIEISVNYHAGEAIANASAMHIEQVLLNLCINASHAMTIMRDTGQEFGGVLTIEIQKIKADQFFVLTHPEAEQIEYWRLLVADTGIGIAKDDVTKVFEPFFSSKTNGYGTGLGLTMVYNIVKNHRGFVDIYTEDGMGTNVYVYLPVYNSGKKIRKEEQKEMFVKGEGCILLAEDEAIVMKTAKEMLEICGYSVMTARDGEECVKIYKEKTQQIDLVILDMVMPKKSGKETFTELKEINEDVKVVLSSGFKRDERVNEIMQMGVKGFIQKPYTIDVLSRIVASLVRY